MKIIKEFTLSAFWPVLVISCGKNMDTATHSGGNTTSAIFMGAVFNNPLLQIII